MPQCTTDPELRKDRVWYEMERDVFSMFELQCNKDEWTDMRVFLETEMDKIDLHDDLQIEQLYPSLCDNLKTANQHRGRRQERKLIVQSLEDPSVPDMALDEDDECFLQYLNASEHDNTEYQRQLYKVYISWYDLFFKSGSICNFCFRGNRDRNSQHRFFLETVDKDGNVAGETNVSMAIESSDTGRTSSGSRKNEADSLWFSAGQDDVDSFPDMGNPSLSNDHSSVNDEKKQDKMHSITTTRPTIYQPHPVNCNATAVSVRMNIVTVARTNSRVLRTRIRTITGTRPMVSTTTRQQSMQPPHHTQ